jgi:hypothetical protein
MLVFDSFQPHSQSAFSTASVNGNPSRQHHSWCEIQVYDIHIDQTGLRKHNHGPFLVGFAPGTHESVSRTGT